MKYVDSVVRSSTLITEKNIVLMNAKQKRQNASGLRIIEIENREQQTSCTPKLVPSVPRNSWGAAFKSTVQRNVLRKRNENTLRSIFLDGTRKTRIQ